MFRFFIFETFILDGHANIWDKNPQCQIWPTVSGKLGKNNHTFLWSLSCNVLCFLCFQQYELGDLIKALMKETLLVHCLPILVRKYFYRAVKVSKLVYLNP